MQFLLTFKVFCNDSVIFIIIDVRHATEYKQLSREKLVYDRILFNISKNILILWNTCTAIKYIPVIVYALFFICCLIMHN